MRFERALITGATSGLGLALAHELATQKIELILCGRNREKLDALADKLKTPVITLAGDLAHSSDRRLLIDLIKQHTPDLIINNAGLGLYGNAFAHPTSEQLEIFEVNANAVFELTVEGARALYAKKRTGTILNISSAAAFFSYPTFTAYAASKACVNSFSQALDTEFTPLGIRVLTACPGQIDTPFRLRASSGHAQKRTLGTMSVQSAVTHILWQIERGKRLYIFDWRYKLLTSLARFAIPSRLLEKLLVRSLKERQG